jgi:uncharacterized protein YndB with AHSA1/START domain
MSLMMMTYIARQSITIHAPVTQIWRALVTPSMIKHYMFGTEVVSDWKKGSPIVWKGVWEGKPYEDKGTILRFEPEQVLQYSHFSPLSGVADSPDNYHNVTVELASQGAETRVTLSQDNNATEDEQKHSEELWGMMLAALKKFVEQG